MQTLTLGETLRRTARRYPNREALVFEGSRVTYRQLDRRVDQLADAFLRRGVIAGDVISVISRNCPEYIEIYFACARIGAVMNAVNHRLKEIELDQVLDHAGSRMLMLEAELQETLEGLVSRKGSLGVVVHQGEPRLPGADRYEDVLSEGRPECCELPVDSKGPVLLLYTLKGGGHPIGALLSHENFIWDSLAYQTHVGFTRRDKILQGMPFHHVAGLHMFTNAAIIQGLPIVIVRHWRAETVCEQIEQERCTAAVIVTTALRQLIETDVCDRFDLSSLQTVLACAGQYDRALITQALYRLGLDRVLFGYGLTEASPLVTITESTGETLWKENCLGWPVWYNDTRIVRPDGLPAEPDQVGELWVRGPNVFIGYHKMPKATAAVLTDDGWLRTGDLVRMDTDGCIFLMGRLGAVIKTGGEMVDVQEVEKAIAAVAPELAQVAVIGRPDPVWGEAVIAYCTLHPGKELSYDELISRLRQQLASFKMPKEVKILERLPCTEAGEVDRTCLV